MNCHVLGVFSENVQNGPVFEREPARHRVPSADFWSKTDPDTDGQTDRQTDGQQTDEQRIERAPYTIGPRAIIFKVLKIPN